MMENIFLLLIWFIGINLVLMVGAFVADFKGRDWSGAKRNREDRKY